MKIKANKDDLNKLLQIALKGISVPAVSPITSMVKVTADADKKTLLIEGTSADSNIVTRMTDVEVDENGQFLLDPKLIIEMGRKSDADTVVIEKKEQNLLGITIGKAKYNVLTYRVSDFPKFEVSGDVGATFKLSLKELTRIAKRIGYAVSRKDTRPVLCGVNFESDGNKLMCVATDSYRLSYGEAGVNPNPFKVTVPQKTLEKALVIFKDDDEIDVKVTNRTIKFKGSNTVFASTLLEGSYPDILRLLPKTFATTIVANRAELLGVVERASLMAISPDGSVIRLEFKDHETVVYAKNSERGDYAEDLPNISFTGDEIKIAVEPTYMRDALESIDAENVSINISEQFKPFIIKAKTDDAEADARHIALVLPMRVHD